MASAASDNRLALRGQDVVDDRELNLLILHHLRNGPCQEAATLLERDLTEQGMLPQRTDFEGNTHPGSYRELVARHNVDPGCLRNLLGQLIASQGSLPYGLQQRSLLKLDRKANIVQLGREGGPPSALAGLLRREAGLMRPIGASAARKDTAMQVLPDRISFMRALRGHKTPVYCVVWDRTGTRFATGSDDRLVKIWSAETGLLIKSCRGHDGEITDFAVSSCNGYVASSSNDCTIRVWHLTGPKTGQPQCILTGHTSPVSYVDFSSTIPNALLSSSFDGTCRIWNILDATAPSVVLNPVPKRFGVSRQAAAAQLQQATAIVQPSAYWAGSRANVIRTEYDAEAAAAAEALGGGAAAAAAASAAGGEGSAGQPTPLTLLCCSFSSCGTFVVAGGNDCSSYLWHWNVSGAAAARPADLAGASSSNSAALADRTAFPSLPLPTEVLRLTGHRHDICLVAFNNSSSAVASASKDGHVRVWRKLKTKPGKPVKFEMWMCLKCEQDQAAATSQRQARRRVQVPSVNQVAWTADDQRILAGLSDNTIRVWDASQQGPAREGDPSGGSRLLYILRGHQEQVHVLSAHPRYGHIVMSAGYDGRMVLWDLAGGRVLRTFGTQDRGGTDTDPVQVLDGHFSPDGTSIVLSDFAGQASVYSTGCRQRLAMAQYDQFLASDYSPLVRDSSGNVIDAETQQPPHLMTGQNLVDIITRPYPEPYQSAFQSGNLREAYDNGALAGLITGGGPNMGGSNWMINVPSPPVIMAAYWHAASQGLSEAVIARRVQEAEDRYAANHQASTFPDAQRLQAIRRGTNNPPQEPRQFQPLANASQQQQGSRRAAGAAPNPAPPGPAWAPTVVRAGPSQQPPAGGATAAAAGGSRSGGYRLDGMPVTGSRPQGARGSAGPSSRASAGSSRQQQQGQQVGGAGPRMVDQQPEFAEVEESSDDDGDYLQDIDEEEDDDEDALDTSDDEFTVGGSSRRRQGGQGGRGRRGGASTSTGLAGTSRDGGRAIRRPRRFESDSDSDGEAAMEMAAAAEEDDMPTPDGETSRRRLRNGKRLREEPLDDRSSRPSKKERRKDKKDKKKRKKRRRESAAHEGIVRDVSAYAWLMGSEPPVPSSSYAPQPGDEVVYLKNIHGDSLEMKQDKLTKMPWLQMRCGRAVLRQAEPCRIMGLEYFIIMNEARGTGVRARLKLTGYDSPLKGREFVVELEPSMPLEFLIPKVRFLKGMESNWGPGDICQILFEDEGLWRAEVILDRGMVAAQANEEYNPELMPYDGVQLHERFQVVWESRDENENPDGTFNYDEPDNVSPWEMLPDDMTEEQLVAAEVPSLHPSIRDRMSAVISRALRSYAFQDFHACPATDACWGGVYYNARIALPISLTEISARLENSFYRTPEALGADVDLMLSNAVAYNGESSEIGGKAQRLVASLKSELGAAAADVTARPSNAGGSAAAEGSSQEAPAAAAGTSSRTSVRIRIPSGAVSQATGAASRSRRDSQA